MTEEKTKKLSREQLYDEIWEISVSGVAKKYNVNYAELLKLCKETDIPIPPSGYWTKLSFGKPVTKILLAESSTTEVTLPFNANSKHPKQSRHTKTFAATMEVSADTQQDENADFEVNFEEEKIELEKQSVYEVSDTLQDIQPTYCTVHGKYNTYNREKLYEEVWTKPVVDVAVQYGVSNVAINKICKSLNVPVPHRGYWAKVYAGQKQKKTPLPATNGFSQVIGARTFEGMKESDALAQPLAFLSDSERQKILLSAQQIKMPADNAKLHKKIIAYKSVVKDWNKKDVRPEGAERSFKNYYNRPPFLAGVISNETLPRVYRILDALYRQVESLGGTVNDDLSLQIRNERVNIEVSEAQDQIKHVLTKQEAQAILIYEDAKRHHSWASEPKIRKNDYVFNGRLRITIRKYRYLKDTDKINVESRLGDMLIELYEESEVVRIDREDREADARKREEENS